MARTRLAIAGSLLFVCLLPAPSFAWDFDEHEKVCRQAYENVCATLNPLAAPYPGLFARWEIACAPGRADVYGQACAVAGDRVGSPEDLVTALGSVRASSDVTYYLLALLNVEHFQPQAPRYWLKYHAEAVELAVKARRGTDQPRILAFEKAIATSAFADHFLADSFSAGHMGFNRGASTAGASKAYHDVWNDNGRWVKSQVDEWFGKGDGHLLDAEKAAAANPAAPKSAGKSEFQRLLDVETSAIQEVLESFVLSGPTNQHYTDDVWKKFPHAVYMQHKPHHCYWFAVDDLQSADISRTAISDEMLQNRCSLSLSTEIQYPSSGSTELDYMLQFSYEPFFLGGDGIVLDFRLGYGREWEPQYGTGTNHRDGLTVGFDVDTRIPFLSTSDGLYRTSFVAGVQSLTWRRWGLFAALRGTLLIKEYVLFQLTAGFADRFYDYNATNRFDGTRTAALAFLSAGVPFEPRKARRWRWEELSEVRMPAKYAYSWAFSPMLQVPFSGTPEWDVVAQAGLGPYRCDMAIVRGFYLELRAGYGREWSAQQPPRSGHRQGPVAGADIDLPFLQSANGLITGDLVVGAQSLWWKRLGFFLGLRSSVYFGATQVQFTAAAIDRTFDYQAEDGWGWNRFAAMGFVSLGEVEGRYPLRYLGVPAAARLEE